MYKAKTAGSFVLKKERKSYVILISVVQIHWHVFVKIQERVILLHVRGYLGVVHVLYLCFAVLS